MYEINYSVDMKTFYKDLNEDGLDLVSPSKLLELKEASKNLSRFYKNYPAISQPKKYIKVATTLRSNPKAYKITNNTERFLSFMFSVDPDLEALLIYGSCNTSAEIKRKLIDYFGIYDPNIIKIEKHFIQNILDKEKKQEIEEEINRRSFS